MTIGIESSANSGNSSGSTVTIDGVTVTSATKLIGVIGVRDLATSDRVVTSMVRDAQAFTEAITADNAYRQTAGIYYLDAPNTGTADLTTTFDGNNGFIAAGTLAVTGLAPGGPEDTDVDTDTGPNPSGSLTHAGASLLVETGVYESGNSATSAGTTIYNENTRRRLATYRIVTSDGTTAMGQTISATQHAYATAAFPIASASTFSIKVWTGSTWQAMPLKHWNGATWAEATLR